MDQPAERAAASDPAAPTAGGRRKRPARAPRDETARPAARARKPRPEPVEENEALLDVDALGGLDLQLDPDLVEEDEDLEILVEEPTGPRSPAGEAALRIGIRRLHPEQERGIAAALDGRDVLMVLPTGFGKSACYQIPSMMLPKPVVLVSPCSRSSRTSTRSCFASASPASGSTARSAARPAKRLSRGSARADRCSS